VIETFGVQGHESQKALAIPATLHEALLARLDRLSSARQVAQLGATLGREFSYHTQFRTLTPWLHVRTTRAVPVLLC
jgi:predicted ATPase